MTKLIPCDCIVVAHKDGRCLLNAVYRCGQCLDNLCAHCSAHHHVHKDLEAIQIESQVIPRAAKELMLKVVVAFDEGRREVLTTEHAAMLRNHNLIDSLCEPTDRGRIAAGDILAERYAQQKAGHNVDGD